MKSIIISVVNVMKDKIQEWQKVLKFKTDSVMYLKYLERSQCFH